MVKYYIVSMLWLKGSVWRALIFGVLQDNIRHFQRYPQPRTKLMLTHVRMDMYTYVCACMCVCVYVCMCMFMYVQYV